MNRRNEIILGANTLFHNQGYNLTSTKDIASRINISEAALYYHFKNKRDLFQEVMKHNLTDSKQILENLPQFNLMSELLVEIIERYWKTDHGKPDPFYLLFSEYSHLSSDEKQLIQNTLLDKHKIITKLITAFIQDESEAQLITWIFMCCTFGYKLFFNFLDLKSVVNTSSMTFFEKLAKFLTPHEFR
jgi:AcrR family transcriptional regulator